MNGQPDRTPHGWAGYDLCGGIPVFLVGDDCVACFQDGRETSSSGNFSMEADEDILGCAQDAVEAGIPVLAMPKGWTDGDEDIDLDVLPTLTPEETLDRIRGRA